MVLKALSLCVSVCLSVILAFSAYIDLPVLLLIWILMKLGRNDVMEVKSDKFY